MKDEDKTQLVRELHAVERRLQQQKPKGNFKWDYPQEVVKDIHGLADRISEDVCARLETLLRWPRPDPKPEVPKVEDADLFYARKLEPKFDRTTDWFEEKGFKKFETPYTFVGNWDRKYINATFLVPNNLNERDVVPVVWYFHGGGFVTGAGDHIPWYSKAALEYAHKNKAIVIAPDYPLMPEGNGCDIYHALRDFLTFYKHDGCFVSGKRHWTDWLKEKMPNEVTINKEAIFIEGESAGGNAIITTIFMNADKEENFKLPIKVVMLRYPMIKHYLRKCITDNVPFMTGTYTKDELKEFVRQLTAEINNIEKVGFMRTRSKGYAPAYMWAAPVLSVTGEWQDIFQRVHGKENTWERNEKWSWDCLERAVNMHDKVDPDLLPSIIIHHGHDDLNCSFEDTENFKTLLQKHYPRTYPDDDRLKLIKVEMLLEKDGVEGKVSTEVGHGYDYWQDKEPFQLECFKFVNKHWLKEP